MNFNKYIYSLVLSSLKATVYCSVVSVRMYECVYSQVVSYVVNAKNDLTYIAHYTPIKVNCNVIYS